MTKTRFNQGAQGRIITTVCGYTASGSMRDCNFKINLHKKKCPICSGVVFPKDFDSVSVVYEWK